MLQSRLLPADIAFLADTVAPERLAEAASRADAIGIEAHEVLLAAGDLTKPAYYAALARQLDLGHFNDALPADSNPEAMLASGVVHLANGYLTAPRGADLTLLISSISETPGLRTRFRLMAPGMLARRTRQEFADSLTNRALTQTPVKQSARAGIVPWQAAVLILSVAALAAGLYIAPAAAAAFVAMATSLLFFSVIAVRLLAAGAAFAGHGDSVKELLRDRELPVYSLLVPLYREAEVAAPLIEALSRLDYPPEKLDIKLIVEADDPETARALADTGLPPWFDVIDRAAV